MFNRQYDNQDRDLEFHFHIIIMMHKCSTAKKPARAAFMHHDDKGHNAWKHYTALKGLIDKVRFRTEISTSLSICVIKACNANHRESIGNIPLTESAVILSIGRDSPISGYFTGADSIIGRHRTKSNEILP